MDKNLKELITVDGLMEAEIIKSKLENYDIPVLLKYEAVSKIFGITMNGIGRVRNRLFNVRMI